MLSGKHAFLLQCKLIGKIADNTGTNYKTANQLYAFKSLYTMSYIWLFDFKGRLGHLELQ